MTQHLLTGLSLGGPQLLARRTPVQHAASGRRHGAPVHAAAAAAGTCMPQIHIVYCWLTRCAAVDATGTGMEP